MENEPIPINICGVIGWIIILVMWLIGEFKKRKDK